LIYFLENEREDTIFTLKTKFDRLHIEN